MDFSKYRNLSDAQAAKIHAQALKGNDAAARGYLAHAVWKKIEAGASGSPRNKISLFNSIFKSLSIKVKRARQ